MSRPATAATALRSVVYSNITPFTRPCTRTYNNNNKHHHLSTSTTFNQNGYGLTPEQFQLQDIAEKFANNELAPHAAEWDRKKIFPVEQLRAAAALGFGGMFVHPDSGGTGLSRFEGSIIFEAMASACTSTTAYLSIHNMCAWMIDSFGTDAQKAKYLPSLLTMDHFSSYCLTEPSAGSDAGSLRTSAHLSPDGRSYILNGSKAFISAGSVSDVYVVMARTGTMEDGPRGITCFIVDKHLPGLSFGAQEKKLGWNSQPTCAVMFDNLHVPVENRLGKEGEGFKIAMKGLDGGRLSIAACSVGAARACYDLARAHVQVRTQFGKPLSVNQSVQFKLADMGTKIHASRLLIRNAAMLLDAKDANATVHCAMAKKAGTEWCFEVCDEALQLFGGYGYLNDYPLERFLRDARVHRILEGTNEVQQMIMSRAALS